MTTWPSSRNVSGKKCLRVNACRHPSPGERSNLWVGRSRKMLVLREKTLLSDNRKLRKHQRFSLVCSTRTDYFFSPKHIFQDISVPLHPHLTPSVHILQPGSRKQHLSVHQTRTAIAKSVTQIKIELCYSARVLCGSERLWTEVNIRDSCSVRE